MNLKAFLFSLVIGSTLLLSTATRAVDFPTPSPAGTLKQRVGLTDIEIVYSRPSAKGRKIFGGLVPYGEVWRTGANASTTISFSTAVKLNGKDVPAGKYALFTIPGESDWTIILNKDTKSSPFSYSATNDVVRFTTTSIPLDPEIETFTFMINNVRDDAASIDLLWEHTIVPIHLTLDIVGTLAPQIDAAMSGSDDKKPYYQAATFYYEHALDLKKAKLWIESIKPENETYYIDNLKARILAKLGEKDAAIAAANKSSELAKKSPGAEGYLKLNEELINSLK